MSRSCATFVKEKLVHIVVDYDTELKTTIREKTCELPDRNIIFAVDDCFCCVEATRTHRGRASRLLFEITLLDSLEEWT